MKKFKPIIVIITLFSIVASATILYVNKSSRDGGDSSTLKLSRDTGNDLTMELLKESVAAVTTNLTASSTRSISKDSRKIFTLKAPYYKQEYEKTCEAAALRMALEYHGIKTNDWDILQSIGYKPRELDFARNIWDDPAEMFVGYADKGKIGYGVHAEPVAKAAKSFGREADVHKNVSARFIAEQILKGYPVIAWGYYIYATPVRYGWKTEEGKDIVGYRGEHTRLIFGFVGEADNPEGFYIHDPNFVNGGAEQYWSVKKLMDNMNIMGELSNQAVVVR